MTLHLNLTHSHRNHGDQQTEVREARRLLKEKIRNDWEFETLPAWTSSGKPKAASKEDDEEDKVAGFRFQSGGSGSRGGALHFDPVEWRERQYSSASDTESDAPRSAKSGSSVYKFDGPESVGTQLQQKRLAKKRKRFAALEEEMQWNDGLAHWLRRRDAWSCARMATEVRLLRSEDATPQQPGDVSSTSESATSSPRTSTSSTARTETSSLATSPDLAATQVAATATPEAVISPIDILVPIAPPILQNHPIRRKIAPNMYPEIYSKIILQSRTPSIPINLQMLVNALVQGWKDDGEWPPKSGPLEKSIGRKKGTGGLRDGVKRILRITGVSEHA